jgi:hypothetical protein
VQIIKENMCVSCSNRRGGVRGHWRRHCCCGCDRKWGSGVRRAVQLRLDESRCDS